CPSASRSWRPNHSVLRRRRLDWDGFLLMMLPMTCESGLDRGVAVRTQALVPELTQHDHRLRRRRQRLHLGVAETCRAAHVIQLASCPGIDGSRFLVGKDVVDEPVRGDIAHDGLLRPAISTDCEPFTP